VRKKDPGPEKTGLLLVDKEAGITSHDVVDRFRKATRIRRVGHTGTLDPMATGLLVLCVGKATRLQSYLMATDKVYEGTIRFGWATDSYDATGEPAGETKDADVSGIDLERVVAPLRGEIDQVPPPFSAKKVDGVRAYELARKGEAPRLEPRRVTVHELDVLDVAGSRVRFRIRCSAGTYVRSIAHDLGQALGIGAHLESLTRTTTSSLHLRDALASTALATIDPEAVFQPPHFRLLKDVELPMPAVMVDESHVRRMQNGQNIVIKPRGEEPIPESSLVAVHAANEDFCCIATVVKAMGPGGVVELQPKVVL
jgi:tRNA pseudouridine55 synthase